MILFIDNYDSFTYNLVNLFGQYEQQLEVVRNDAIHVTDVEAINPDGVVISPGPGTPDDAGISMDIIRRYHSSIPILGVCLGHQCIGQVFGARIIRASEPVHGKTAQINHSQTDIYEGLPSPFEATRYHSLIIDPDSIPNELHISARSDDGTIMSVRHRESALTGVQYHPESILTTEGSRLIANWLHQTRIWQDNRSARAG